MSNETILEYIDDQVDIIYANSYDDQILKYLLSRAIQYRGLRLEGFGNLYIKDWVLHVEIINPSTASFNDLMILDDLWTKWVSYGDYVVFNIDTKLLKPGHDYPLSRLYDRAVEFESPISQKFYDTLLKYHINNPDHVPNYNMKTVLLDNLSCFEYVSDIVNLDSIIRVVSIPIDNPVIGLFRDTHFEYNCRFFINKFFKGVSFWNLTIQNYEEYTLTDEEYEFLKLKYMV